LPLQIQHEEMPIMNTQPESAPDRITQEQMERIGAVVAEVFPPLDLARAKELVGRDLAGSLHSWRRLWHHANATGDAKTADFLSACIEDMERIQTRTYRDGEPSI
jgi:hypothetical protein